MSVFFSTALPWILVGIALAILAVSCGMEKQNDARQGARIALGAGLGLLLGLALSSFGVWDDHALCLALGPLWGMALASLYQGKSEEQ